MKKKYDVMVVFTTTLSVSVEAEDADEAMDTAEYHAQKEFAYLLDNGKLYSADFTCEAQEP